MAIQNIKDAIIDAEKFDQYKPGNRGAYSPNAGNTPGANRYGGPKVDVNVRGPRGVFNDALNRGRQQSAYRQTAQDRGMGRAARTPGAGSGGARAGGIPKSGTVGYNKPSAGGVAGGASSSALRSFRFGNRPGGALARGLRGSGAALVAEGINRGTNAAIDAATDGQAMQRIEGAQTGIRSFVPNWLDFTARGLAQQYADHAPEWAGGLSDSELAAARKYNISTFDDLGMGQRATPQQPVPDAAPSPEHEANMRTIQDYETRQAEAYRSSLRNAMQGGEARDAQDLNTAQVAGFTPTPQPDGGTMYVDGKGSSLRTQSPRKSGGTLSVAQGPGGAYDPTLSRQENIQRNVDAYDRQTAALKSLREAQRYDKQGNYIRTPEEVDAFYRQAREEAAATPGYGERLALRNAAVSRNSGNKAAFAAEAASRKDARDKQLAGVIAENEAQAKNGSGKTSLRDQIALAQLQRSLGKDAYDRSRDAVEDARKTGETQRKQANRADDTLREILGSTEKGYQDIIEGRESPEAELAVPELGKTLRDQTKDSMSPREKLLARFWDGGPELPNLRTGPTAEWARKNLVLDDKGQPELNKPSFWENLWNPWAMEQPYYETIKGYEIPAMRDREGWAFDALRRR